MSDNFIRTYDKVLTKVVYDSVLSHTDGKSSYDVERMQERTVKRKKDFIEDTQILLEPLYPDIARHITELVMNRMVVPYFQDFPTAKVSGRWTSGSTLFQRTEPGGGYHLFHGESTGWYNSTRVLAWMIYLNDLPDDDDGGETEFLNQKCRFKPKKNMGLIWPGGITHLHRGNPPLKRTKKILTGWITPCNDIHYTEPNWIEALQSDVAITQKGTDYKR